MLTFPKSTEVNRRIPKNKFYEKLDIAAPMEKLFTQEIDTIYWRYKLAPDTLNVAEGQLVKEIELFEINLKVKDFKPKWIELIDREIPYHLVFLLRFGDWEKLWISYKESNKNQEDKFKVETCYQTPWAEYNSLSLKILGLNLDRIYEHFLLQVAGDHICISHEDEIKGAVETTKQIQKLEADILRMESKIKNEKQFKNQVKLNNELRELKERMRCLL